MEEEVNFTWTSYEVKPSTYTRVLFTLLGQEDSVIR